MAASRRRRGTNDRLPLAARPFTPSPAGGGAKDFGSAVTETRKGRGALDPAGAARDHPSRTGKGGSMLSFTYEQLPARVVFGAGALSRLPEELDRLGARRALVLSTPEQRAQAE